MAKTATYRVVSNPVGYPTVGLKVLFAGESQTNPSHRIGPKVVDYYLLHHVMTGRGTFAMGDFEATLHPGDSFLIYPGQLVRYAADDEDPWHYRWVAFAGPGADDLVRETGFTAEAPVAHTGASLVPSKSCQAIFETFRERRESASLTATGHLHMLLGSLREASAETAHSPPRPDSHHDELTRQVVGYLSTQYAEPITIEGMAETLGYNRAYLSRVFKKHTGLSPVTFLTKLRVDRARRLLRERPELTVEQIASSVGFLDALYFSKQFRRWYAQAPTEYRASVNETLKKQPE